MAASGRTPARSSAELRTAGPNGPSREFHPDNNVHPNGGPSSATLMSSPFETSPPNGPVTEDGICGVDQCAAAAAFVFSGPRVERKGASAYGASSARAYRGCSQNSGNGLVRFGDERPTGSVPDCVETQVAHSSGW